jgi:hypothetical protein
MISMHIPVPCKQWQDVMDRSGHAKHRGIVANLRNDECLDKTVAAEFFRRLGAMPVRTTSEEAYSQSYEVIRADLAHFTCTGLEVEPEPSFGTLFRLETVTSLLRRVPEECKKRGIKKDHLLHGIPIEDLAVLTDEYTGPVSLGNGLGLVWVSDAAIVEPIEADLRALADRLGLQLDGEPGSVILCVYNRKEVATQPHVPRAFDAIDQENWSPNNDCLARTGRTRPLTRPEEGLPEAVHRGCVVTPRRWESAVL